MNGPQHTPEPRDDGQAHDPPTATSRAVPDGAAARILESMTDAFFALDRTWRFTYLNPQAERLLQRARAALLGEVLWDEFPAAVGSLFEREYRRAAQEGVTVSFEAHYPPPLDAWFEVRAYPSADGGLSVFFQDITVRKHNEQALREGERRFRALADNIAQLAWMAHADGAIFWYNQRWFDYTGTTLEQMRGWGWRAVHHPDHLARVEAKFRAHVEAGRVWEDTFPLRNAGGTYRWFLSRAAPVRDEEGRVVLWCGTNTDVTEQREAAAALREAAERQRALLREVLASVTGERLRLVESEAELPAPLVEAGAPIPLTPEAGLRDLRERVREAAAGLGFPAERCMDLVTAASEGGMNAVVHGGGRGEARVSTDGAGTVQVRICDWGGGISAQDLPRAALKRGWSSGASLGHGLAMMLQSADRLFLKTGPAGTTLVLEQEREEPPPAWL